MIRLKDFEYDIKFKSDFSPKPEVYHFSEPETFFLKKETKNDKKDILNKDFAENLQKEDIKQEKITLSNSVNNEIAAKNKEIAVVDSVSYEIKNITPKKLFRRKKDV